MSTPTEPTPTAAASAQAGKPYYQDEYVTIYHGDGRQLISLFAVGAVILTDQPYGTGWARGGKRAGEFKAKHEKPEWDVWDISWIEAAQGAKRIAAFCPVGKCEELTAALPHSAVLHYLKSNVRPGGIAREPIVSSPPPGNKGDWKFTAYNGDMPLHPCQKPIEVMEWLVALLSNADDVIVDLFAGSGTTGRAAKNLNRRCVLIEREERYCEIAAKRMGQEVLALT